MKRLGAGLIILPLVLVAQSVAQDKQFGEAPQREVAAYYRDSWKVVVGAKGIRPVIALNGGQTKTLPAESLLGFPKQDKVLPLAGEVKMLSRVVKNPYPFPDENVRSVTLEFVPQQDFDNLYIVFFLFTRDERLIGSRVREVGKVQANSARSISYDYIFKDHEKPPEVRFYSNGREVRVTE